MQRTPFEHLTILKMGIEDLPEVLAISSSFPINPWTEKMFLEEMANPLSSCFVVKMGRDHNSPIIGFICFREVRDESELLHLCVHPQYRQRGVGKRLMQFYIDFCLQRGIRTFYLEVDPSNRPALHLYKLFSYQSLMVRKNFYPERREGLVMVKETLKSNGTATQWNSFNK